MVAEVKAAAKVGDSLGGVTQVVAYGVPVGLGSHVHWDRRLDGALAGALMSIQAVKAVELGDGSELAGRRGSEAHDAIRLAGPGDEDAVDPRWRVRTRHPPGGRPRGRDLDRFAHRGPSHA